MNFGYDLKMSMKNPKNECATSTLKSSGAVGCTNEVHNIHDINTKCSQRKKQKQQQKTNMSSPGCSEVSANSL